MTDRVQLLRELHAWAKRALEMQNKVPEGADREEITYWEGEAGQLVLAPSAQQAVNKTKFEQDVNEAITALSAYQEAYPID